MSTFREGVGRVDDVSAPLALVARSRPLSALRSVFPPIDLRPWSVGSLGARRGFDEAIGPSKNMQVMNYGVDNLSSFTPIYENGTPVRVAIVNYLDDPTGAVPALKCGLWIWMMKLIMNAINFTGANDVHAAIAIAGAGATMLSSGKVKYLAATLVVQKGGYAWAGQFLRVGRAADGDSDGEHHDGAVRHDGADVPAPGFALVFFNDDAFTEDKGMPSMTFATKTHNTVTADPTVFATSNGNRMSDHDLAGTSKPPSAAPRTVSASVIAAAVVVGAVVAVLGRVMLDSGLGGYRQTAEGDDCLLHSWGCFNTRTMMTYLSPTYLIHSLIFPSLVLPTESPG
ncbi:hypothetical protein C8R46DRAFT_1034846 [Mycena filopes]|nr:hypothetical protein C8R46DRAFT_1034846 [Mycena filopes]